ncbi:MAG: hypothetical protein ACLRFL_03330 [Clostridia bacterium]
MIKSLKSNKITIIFLLIIAILFISNPTIYVNSCLSAVSVWSTKVFPTLFPFFIITRLIVSLSEFRPNPLDKFFSKIYHTPTGSLNIFLLSAISGYPMGAKMISNLYDQKLISTEDSKKMLSFTSISGPMFMIGTIGVSVLGSFRAGLVIMISNVLAGLINGLLYRGYSNNKSIVSIKNQPKSNLISDTIYDSLNSILMVGAYIIVGFLLIQIIESTKILHTISSVFPNICDGNVVSSILTGLIEITHGSIDLSTTSLSLVWKTMITSTMIAFGGLCILLQSMSFIKQLNIPTKTLLLQKTTQALITFIISLPLAFLIL